MTAEPWVTVEQVAQHLRARRGRGRKANTSRNERDNAYGQDQEAHPHPPNLLFPSQPDPTVTDEAKFDLTPATEKAIAWLLSLTERPFVGTESRLLTLFALLEQISAGTGADPIKRVGELRKKRDDLDAEIARVLAGDVPLLDDTAVKDRFQQLQQLARELLADFREVEHNFRLLDRKVREKIALWRAAQRCRCGREAS